MAASQPSAQVHQRLTQFRTFLPYFLVANALSVALNHIDDTDETFGYWEPLHYLLYGVGMQTWEYAPTYAIRTYAFISPFWVFGWVLHNVLHLDKVLVFYAIRMLLATVASFSESCFVAATFATYGESLGILTALFTLFSSGILYAATAFLPSAVIMSIVMLALSAWMRRRYELTIFCGCVAVLWSGWPFVGVLFVPLGLHMLWDTYTHNRGGVLAVARLAAIGVVILIVTGVSAGIIDVYCYGKKYVNWLLV